MSGEEDFFAPPAFKPEQALLTLKRHLRDLRALQNRGDSFLLQGQVVLEFSLADGCLQARLAKRPAQRPEWDLKLCKNSADVRSLQDEIKRRLARWTDESQ
ncbi:hypothetical protein HNP55_000857 [Paucibacter oligotrophus]|uniref:Uncharacterized protein n=1 Tax=Roseateles oligotrophus TaxID=1769250 RepID=A0A840L6P9_9BURK|nr:hypothetical protein [Roseateles oligotrophus]MBB4842362.1 hypothetical protein [Roseateles oligotrophus]